MLLLHGTGWNTARLIMIAMRDKKTLGMHNVTWKNISQKDRIYFWVQPGKVDEDSVSIKQDMVIRAGESAMYVKAISGKQDKKVCVLVVYADESGQKHMQPDPDGAGMTPAVYITIDDFNRCVQNGSIRLITAVYDELYHPELRWEYLATMRAAGPRPPAYGIADKEEFLTAAKKIVFGEGVEIWDKRLFKEPLMTANWKLMV